MTFIAPHTVGTTGSPARHLPAGCSVRRAVPGDAEHVATLLRADDRLEMEALEGRPALDVLQGWMSGGSHVLVVRGDAVAIFGIVACDIPGAVACDVPGASFPAEHRAATPWAAMVSTLGGEDLVNVMWLSRFQIDAWQRQWPVLQTVCDSRNRFRGQWLDWLDFERRGRLECFGAAGRPFDLHVRLRDMAQPPLPCRTQ
jgi:hypothetical protein